MMHRCSIADQSSGSGFNNIHNYFGLGSVTAIKTCRPASRSQEGDFRECAPIQSGQDGFEVVLTGAPSLRQDSTTERIAATLGPACALPTCSQFFLPRATGRIEFSARL